MKPALPNAAKLAALSAAILLGATACAPDTSASPLDTTVATSQEDAQKILQEWIDKSPSNNDDRSEVITIGEPDDRWSVFAVPNWSDSGTFQCVAITSAKPTMFTYAEFVPTGVNFLEWLTSGDFHDEGTCDQTVPAITQPLTQEQKTALADDWESLRKIVTDNRQSPYSTASRFTTPLANYTVTESKVVSTTETRLRVQQTSLLATTVGGKPQQKQATLVISPDGVLLETAD